MQTLERIIKAETITRQLTVNASLLNDRGELATCIILKEMMALNDQVVMRSLGSLNYYTFFTTWHRVELMNEAAMPGDNIELTAEYYYTRDISLEISITVRRKAKNIIVAEGYFSFTMKSLTDKSVSLW